MVDGVFTWVNGNDPVHKRKRLRYQSESENKTRASDVYETARSADAGELWFALHLLRKNASWIRKIFLITDDQRPHWLTESKAIKLGVTVIDHRTIFSGFEDVLPTFNSRSIENMIFTIPIGSHPSSVRTVVRCSPFWWSLSRPITSPLCPTYSTFSASWSRSNQ